MQFANSDPMTKLFPMKEKKCLKEKNDTKGNDDIELAEIKSFQPSEAAMQDHLHCDAFCNQKRLCKQVWGSQLKYGVAIVAAKSYIL